MNEQDQYKYQSDKDIIKDCLKSFDGYFNVFFKSFKIDKKAFVFQASNLVLVFVLINFFVAPLINMLLGGIKGASMVGLRIFLLLISVMFISLVSKNSVFKWQTLFEMDYKMAKKYFFRFIVLNLMFYGGKKLYKYEAGNK